MYTLPSSLIDSRSASRRLRRVAAVGLCDHVPARCAVAACRTAGAATRLVRYAAVEPAERAEWIGSYEGMADIYLANEDQWQRDVPIELFMRQDGSHVRIMGQMALAASRSFTSVKSRRMTTRCWWVNTPTETVAMRIRSCGKLSSKGVCKDASASR